MHIFFGVLRDLICSEVQPADFIGWGLGEPYLPLEICDDVVWIRRAINRIERLEAAVDR